MVPHLSTEKTLEFKKHLQRH